MRRESELKGVYIINPHFSSTETIIDKGDYYVHNDTPSETGQPKTSLVPQYIAAIIGSIFALSVGMNTGWPGPALPKLLDGDGPFPLSVDQEALLSNSLFYGTIYGNVMGSILPNVFGRKPTLLLAAIPLAITCLLINVGDSYIIFCLARLIAGVGSGLVFSVLPAYYSEISTPEIRGHISSIFMLQFHFGIFIEYAIAPLLTIQTNAMIMTAFPVIGLVLFFFMPETPYYYVYKNRDKSAVKSLNWLHRDVEDMELMKKYKEINSDWRIYDLVRSKANLKALCLSLLVNFMTQFSGTSVWTIYALIIFQEDSPGSSTYQAGIIFSIASFLSIAFFGKLSDRFGRRRTLLCSSITTAFSLFILSLYFYAKTTLDLAILSNLTWCSLVFMILSRVCTNISLTTLPTVVAGELFPTNLRPIAGSVLSMFSSLAAVAAVQVYEYLKNLYGLPVVFLFFAFVLLFTSTLAYFVYPETKGKTLEEIQSDLKK